MATGSGGEQAEENNERTKIIKHNLGARIIIKVTEFLAPNSSYPSGHEQSINSSRTADRQCLELAMRQIFATLALSASSLTIGSPRTQPSTISLVSPSA